MIVIIVIIIILVILFIVFRKEELKSLVIINPYKSIEEQPNPNFFHNRFHPDIPPIYKIEQNKEFKVECMEWTGGMIQNNDNADDVKNVDLSKVHYLSGPFSIEGASPGDLLKVDIVDLGFIKGHEWGFTGIFDNKNGGGFLTDLFPKAGKVIWDLDNYGYATSRHLPGIRFLNLIHLGLIGTAPSLELLNEWNRREKKLVENNKRNNPVLANLPTSNGAWIGKLQDTKEGKEIALNGARTVPARENGGNTDVKELTIGSSVYFPVFVEGANLSFGDMHYCQSDGEISFCGAIEMAGYAVLKCSVIKDGMNKYNIKSPIFITSPHTSIYNNYLVFEGTSVLEHDEKGEKLKENKQLYLNTSIAYRNACLNAINYLTNFGYTKEQAYVILSTSPCNGKISGIVDIPNSVATLQVPIDIFEDDIRPSNKKIKLEKKGQIPLSNLIDENIYNPMLDNSIIL